jgi:hypothetical protein
MNKQTFAGPPLRLAVTYRALADLIPDPRNARTHPKRQIDQLRASIEAFGFTNPILVDPEGHIIAGHGRLQAARTMGLAELPVITLSGLSEVQKRTLRIADNKIALNAGWDLEILKLELGELASSAGGGPPEQFDACGHVRAPCPPVARLELHVPGQASEFQRHSLRCRPPAATLPDPARSCAKARATARQGRRAL